MNLQNKIFFHQILLMFCTIIFYLNGHLYWEFYYEDYLHTRPYEVYYNASFIGGDCEPIEELFDNKGT